MHVHIQTGKMDRPARKRWISKNLLATAKPIMSGISPGSDTIGTSMNHILTYARAYLYNWD